jgi:hypothetical protein
MHIYDLVRLAIQEFIERRPEYFDEGFNYHNFKMAIQIGKRNSAHQSL